MSCMTPVRNHSSCLYLEITCLKIFTPGNLMLDVKVQCQIYNHFINAAEKLNNTWFNFLSLFPFFFQIRILSFCIHPPELHTQILFNRMVCRKTDGKVASSQKDDPSWQARKRGAFFTLLTWCWSLGCWCLVL